MQLQKALLLEGRASQLALQRFSFDIRASQANVRPKTFKTRIYKESRTCRSFHLLAQSKSACAATSIMLLDSGKLLHDSDARWSSSSKNAS